MTTTTTTTGKIPAEPRPLWRRLIGFNLLTAVILGVGGYYLGWWIGHLVTEGKSFANTLKTDENDTALLVACVTCLVLGVPAFGVGRRQGSHAGLDLGQRYRPEAPGIDANI